MARLFLCATATVNDLYEMSLDELCAKVRWLEAERAIDQWKLGEVHGHMAQLEAHLDQLEVPVSLRAPVVFDLTHEEDEGGVRGPIILADETPAPESVVPPSEEWELNSDDERALAGLLVGITLEKEWKTDGEYTPTGLYGLDFDL